MLKELIVFEDPGVHSPLNLGLMGGTFDPIHLGHLAAAEEVRTGFGLDKIVFIPSARPPHKSGKVITDSEHRYTMTVLATVDNPHFEVSRIEIDRPGPSYTIDTVRHFKSRHPHDKLYFITGADAILEIFTWKDARALLEMCEFIAVTRPGYDLTGLGSLAERLSRETVSNIHPFSVTALAISSSELRQRIAMGRSIRYLVPDMVEQYIYKTGLYKQK